MFDLSSIKKYIDEPDSFMINFIPHEIQSVGLDSFLEYNFRNLDCTRVYKDGLRPMQTIGHPYRHIITQIIFIIKNYIEEDKQDEYFERLIKQHRDNLEYEKTNPPIWYGTEKDRRKYERQYENKDSTKPKLKRTKQQNIDSSDKPKRQTVAEKKLAAKVIKLNSLSFKIKPKN